MAYPASRLEFPAAPSTAATNTAKQKRARFCHRHAWKSRETASIAQRLADLLRENRNKFPGFAGRIDQFIATVETDAKRSRAYDREKVVGLLRDWSDGLTVKELMEDTGYSQWDIRQILADLINKKRVTARLVLRSGRNVKVYSLETK